MTETSMRWMWINSMSYRTIGIDDVYFNVKMDDFAYGLCISYLTCEYVKMHTM